MAAVSCMASRRLPRAVHDMASDGSLDPGRLLSGYRNVSGPGGFLAIVTRMGPRVLWLSLHLWYGTRD